MDVSTNPPDDLGDQRRTERRQFIRDHHPDRGGDPEEFIAGLRKRSGPRASLGQPPVVFHRRPRGTRRLRLMATHLIHRTIRRPKQKPRVR